MIETLSESLRKTRFNFYDGFLGEGEFAFHNVQVLVTHFSSYNSQVAMF